MISEDKKVEIVKHLLLVPTESIYGGIVKNFTNSLSEKTDFDIVRLIWEIKQQMIDGPKNMQEVLGTSFNYFYTLEFN